MHDFQWIVSGFLLRHLTTELTVAGIVLIAVIVLTAIFVGKELRETKEEDHADQ